MDSLTQMALGAAVGVAIGGKKYGKKSALMGAICGTLPDLDFIPLIGQDPVTTFTYHRGFSHSILFAVLATPLIAWGFSKIKWFGAGFKNKTLQALIFLCFFTHIILDALTVYGTQLFWPLNTPPVSIGSVFIIDLLYTLPLLIGLGIYFVNKSVKTLNIALILSTLYLLWGVGIQHHVKNIFKENYDVPYNQVMVQTTPFNTFLWRILVMTDAGYEVGYYSIFDKTKDIKFKNYESKPALIEPIADSFAVKRLQWFTHGFYAVNIDGNNITMTDLRMGLEPYNYIFGFVVGEKQGNVITATENKRYSQPRGAGRLKTLWARIWDETIEM